MVQATPWGLISYPIAIVIFFRIKGYSYSFLLFTGLSQSRNFRVYVCQHVCIFCVPPKWFISQVLHSSQYFISFNNNSYSYIKHISLPFVKAPNPYKSLPLPSITSPAPLPPAFLSALDIDIIPRPRRGHRLFAHSLYLAHSLTCIYDN